MKIPKLHIVPLCVNCTHHRLVSKSSQHVVHEEHICFRPILWCSPVTGEVTNMNSEGRRCDDERACGYESHCGFGGKFFNELKAE